MSSVEGIIYFENAGNLYEKGFFEFFLGEYEKKIKLSEKTKTLCEGFKFQEEYKNSLI